MEKVNRLPWYWYGPYRQEVATIVDYLPFVPWGHVLCMLHFFGHLGRVLPSLLVRSYRRCCGDELH